jgi:putative chitinase
LKKDLFDYFEEFMERFFGHYSSVPHVGPTTLPVIVEPILTDEQLAKIMPRIDADKRAECLPHLLSAMKEHQIDVAKRRVAMFLAQLAHESGELRWLEEIASGEAYEGRKDLGNVNHGDGKRYKGRGPIQLTGRSNYRAAGAALGLDLEDNPWKVALPEVGFRVAGWYWTTRGLNALSDAGDVEAVTKKINGGTNGLVQRQMYYSRALDALGAI